MKKILFVLLVLFAVTFVTVQSSEAYDWAWFMNGDVTEYYADYNFDGYYHVIFNWAYYGGTSITVLNPYGEPEWYYWPYYYAPFYYIDYYGYLYYSYDGYYWYYY